MSKKPEYNTLKNKVIFHKYKTSKILGKGSFGCVFQGINIKSKKMVAIKVEDRKSESSLLGIETSFLSLLKGYGIPKLIGYGKYGNFNVMIQEILGFNLMQIKALIHHFTIKDIAMMGIQILDRIEFIHSKYIIHRDIKPENFTTGFEDISTIYLIDFGISRKYRSSRTLKHVKYALTGRMFGTVRYASYNASRGVEQSRRDDLESIANMLIYIYTGKLPWKGINLKDRQRKKKYLEMLLLKKFTSPEKICEGMPDEYVDFYKYCKSLNFEQDPDYEYLRNIFRKILSNCLVLNDYKFSWILNKNYLKNVKVFNNKIDTKNIKKEKYINIFTRANSPGNRLYHIIKNSLEKNEIERYKKSIGNSENIFTHNNINSNLDLDSIKTYNRGASEDMIQISGKNDISENQNNLNKSKMDFTYKSDLSQYNMNVDEFQDETKICEQNKTMINMIKNNENANLNNTNYIDLQSFNNIYENKNSNNKFSISQILNDFKMNLDIKDKLNLSMDLGFNYNKNKKNNNKKYNNRINGTKNNIVNDNKINYIYNNEILNEIKDDFIIRPKSQDIKNNFTKIINLTDKETEIKKNQEELYNYIFNRIKNYVNKLVEKRLYQRNIINKKPNYNRYIKKKVIYKTEKNNYNEVVSSNFSFKNLNVEKNAVNNLPNKNINQYQQKMNNLIKNSHINEINIKKAINKTEINNNFNNNIKIKRENNIHKKIPSKNNILANDKRINIIINTTLNSFGKLSQKNKDSEKNIFNKNQNLVPNKQSNNFLDNNNIKNIHLVNSKSKKNNNSPNHIYNEEIRNNNFMKQISKNKNNIILIPKQNRPLLNKTNNLQFFYNRNKQLNFSDNKIYFITNKTNLSPNNLKNLTLKPRIKNSNGQISSQENIRTFEYKSIFRNKKNSEEKNISNKFKEKINIVKLPNFSIKQLKKNNSYDSIPYKINLQNKFNHVSLSCSNQNITNQSKIQYYNINQKKNKNIHFRIKHYSPDNNMLKNKYVNLFSKNGFAFSNIMNKRSNSDSKKKKVLNYNNINLSDNENSRASIHKPKNLNNLNNYNYIPLETKCYNFIKI